MLQCPDSEQLRCGLVLHKICGGLVLVPAVPLVVVPHMEACPLAEAVAPIGCAEQTLRGLDGEGGSLDISWECPNK